MKKLKKQVKKGRLRLKKRTLREESDAWLIKTERPRLILPNQDETDSEIHEINVVQRLQNRYRKGAVNKGLSEPERQWLKDNPPQLSGERELEPARKFRRRIDSKVNQEARAKADQRRREARREKLRKAKLRKQRQPVSYAETLGFLSYINREIEEYKPETKSA